MTIVALPGLSAGYSITALGPKSPLAIIMLSGPKCLATRHKTCTYVIISKKRKARFSNQNVTLIFGDIHVNIKSLI